MKFLRNDDELFGDASSNVNSKLGLGDLDLPNDVVVAPVADVGEGLYPRGMGEGEFPRLVDGLALP